MTTTRTERIRKGDRVSFDWFGKRRAGFVVDLDDPYALLGTPHALVWNGLERKHYEVALADLVANPLFVARETDR